MNCLGYDQSTAHLSSPGKDLRFPSTGLSSASKEVDSIESFNRVLASGSKRAFGASVYSAWFQNLRFNSFDGKILELSVNSARVRDCISLHHQDKISSIALRAYSKCFHEEAESVSFIVSESDIPLVGNDEVFKEAEQANVISLFAENEYPVTLPTLPNLTFKNFIEGQENSLALKMSQMLSTQISEGGSALSKILYLHGSVGNGKTHLLQSIVSSISKQSPDKRVVYTTAERFMLYYINSIRENKLFDFQRIFLNLDLLVVDDLHFVCKKKKTVEELYRVVSSIMSSTGSVVFASVSLPSGIPLGHESFVSILKSGNIAEIQMPDEDLRYRILKHRSIKHGVADDILKLMAHKVNSNIRELEGAFGRMVLNSQILEMSSSFSGSSKTLFYDVFSLETDASPVTVSDIKTCVSKHYNLTTEELISDKRTKKISTARQVGIFLASELTCLSYTDLGHEFGGKKHSTVIHAIKSINKLTTENPSIKNDIKLLKMKIKSETI